jgi:BirA family biotin operon repressor/biotin-[acetyl-CoA-carboxylase] ligase
VGHKMIKRQPDMYGGNSLFIGQNHIYLPYTDSTNAWLKKNIAVSKLPEGTVVSAGFQTEGRGQAGTFWDSTDGLNILLSVLFYPSFLKAQDQFEMSKAMALAVRDFVSKFLDDFKVQIKWPNDILVDGKKICGILIENGLQGEQIEYCIVGIGINVNELPLENERASLKVLTGIEYDIEYLEKQLFSCIEARYLQLRAKSDAISKDYLTHLYGMATKLWYINTSSSEKFEGTISGINHDGRLKMATEEGEKLFSLKEVRLLK